MTYPSESAFCFLDSSTLIAPDDPRIGATLGGRYVIERELGSGGMAIVYKGRHRLVEQPCAIKLLKQHSAADPVLRERFVREARHAQRLSHPNIIEIFDQGDADDGTPYLVMELLEGASLADMVEAGPIPLRRTIPIAIGIARALARAHDFEVIHRDLKPENVFVLAGDHVKLLDFGIARCTQDSRLTNLGEVFGTPQYMAPERGSSIDAGPAADLYALGVMLFEMLTQRLPFEAGDPASFLLKHMKDVPPRLRSVVPEAPEGLDQLISDLMAKDPADRPIDAHLVKSALAAIAQQLHIELPEEPRAGKSGGSLSVALPIRDPWKRRVELFEQMFTRGPPASMPPDSARLLELIKVDLRNIANLRATAVDELAKLAAIEEEAREGRQRLGRAMDALTTDIFKTREVARAQRARVTPLSEGAKAFVPQCLAAHREVVLWEGRSGFAEPYRELSSNYRHLADLVDAWHEVRQRELAAEALATKTEREIADVDFQIRALRESLSNLEKNLDVQRRASQNKLAEMGRRTDQLEADLLHCAGRFCGPLRSRPELGQLFAELERTAA
jgi:serine/threonine-protein kinase